MKTSFWSRIFGLLAILTAVPLVNRANDVPQMPEDIFPGLRQILTDAVSQSPRMVENNLGLMAADGDLQQAKSGLYPSILGSYQFSKARDQREDQVGTLKADKTYYNLALSQPLFHWGERVNTARIGEIRREIANENYREAYRLLSQEIRSGYMAIILGKLYLENATYSQRLADEALQLAENQLQKKVISEGAIFQTRMAAEQARLDRENADWSFQQARQNLAALTGQSVLEEAQIPSHIPGLATAKPQVDRLLAGFLTSDSGDRTAGLRVAHRQIEVDELTYKNQRTRLRPKLNFVAGLSQDQQSYTINSGAQYGLQSQYVGLLVTWSIFDGLATRGAIISALARKRISEHNYKQMTEATARDAQRAAKSVELAQRQLAISERLLNNAQNFLNYTQDDFKRGQASETDVNNAQAGYNNLNNSTNSSRYNYLLKVADFVSLIDADPVLDNLNLSR